MVFEIGDDIIVIITNAPGTIVGTVGQGFHMRWNVRLSDGSIIAFHKNSIRKRTNDPIATVAVPPLPTQNPRQAVQEVDQQIAGTALESDASDDDISTGDRGDILTVGIEANQGENLLNPHGQLWTYVDHPIPREQANRYLNNPLIRWPNDLIQLSQLERDNPFLYFMLCFPTQFLPHLLNTTNIALGIDKPLSNGEFLKWIGLRIAMLVNPRSNIHQY